jgi:hypothetical protein
MSTMLTHHVPKQSVDYARAGGLTKEDLEFLDAAGNDWDQRCQGFVTNMRACGWCGRVAFAAESNPLHANMRQLKSNGTPCGVAANPILQPISKAKKESCWWACQACANSSQRRKLQKKIQPPLTDDDQETIKALLQLPPGASLQVSVLKCGLRVVQRAYGYWQATPMANAPLMSGPLAVYNTETRVWDKVATDHMLQLIVKQHLSNSHPIFTKYQTMWEMDTGTNLAGEHRDRHAGWHDAMPQGPQGRQKSISSNHQQQQQPLCRQLCMTETSSSTWV